MEAKRNHKQTTFASGGVFGWCAWEADFGGSIEHHGRAMVGTVEEVVGECLSLKIYGI